VKATLSVETTPVLQKVTKEKRLQKKKGYKSGIKKKSTFKMKVANLKKLNDLVNEVRFS